MSWSLFSKNTRSFYYGDSQITDHMLPDSTRLNLPVLGAHDSFIVDYRRVGVWKLLMEAAAEEVVGVNLPVKTARPEAEDLPHAAYVATHQVPRSYGYVQRRTEHISCYGSLAKVRTPR